MTTAIIQLMEAKDIAMRRLFVDALSVYQLCDSYDPDSRAALNPYVRHGPVAKEVEQLQKAHARLANFSGKSQNAGIEADVFHETLALTQRRNWVHPTQLAHRMSASSSNVRKWFLVDPKKRSTPSPSTMADALRAIADLISQDIRRAEAGQPMTANTIRKP